MYSQILEAKRKHGEADNVSEPDDDDNDESGDNDYGIDDDLYLQDLRLLVWLPQIRHTYWYNTEDNSNMDNDNNKQ